MSNIGVFFTVPSSSSAPKQKEKGETPENGGGPVRKHPSFVNSDGAQLSCNYSCWG